MVNLISTSELKEEISTKMMLIFQGKSEPDFKRDIDTLDKYVEVWADENNGQLEMKIQVPKLRTKNMEKGINIRYRTDIEDILDNIAGGYQTNTIDGGKSYKEKKNKEQMFEISCKFDLAVWRSLSEKLAEKIAVMQVALQQQHIWVEVGSNGEAINRIGTATKGFPDQHDFVIGDEEEGFSEELREPVKRNETSQESFADVVTGSADGKIFEKEMMNFNELCSEIIDILEDPPGKAMKRFEKIRPNSELLDKFMDNKIKSNKIESLAEDVDGAILFTSLFSNKLKLINFLNRV